MADKKRIARRLSEDEVRKVISLSPNDISKDKMIELFANFEDKEAMFLPADYFTLSKTIINEYAKSFITQNDIQTTVGRYITNLFLFMHNPKILCKLGYINETIDSGKIGDISNDIASLILEEKLSVEEFYDYLDRLNWFGFANSAFTTPSINYDIVKPLPDVIKRRNQLLKDNEEAIDAGDVKVSSAIESELIDMAKQELKDNPAIDLYTSGAKVNFGNQYKNMNIMGGPTINNVEGGYRMIKKSYIEGIEKEDVIAQGDSIVTGVYSRAVGTQKGGYEGKKMLASFQTMHLDKQGTDCGSEKYLRILLTKNMKQYVMYRYIKKGNSLVEITPENIDSLVDTYINLRSPMYCKNKNGYCNICGGNYFYKIGNTNIGLAANKVSSIALNTSLKKFHDMSIHTGEIDWTKYVE